MDSAAFALPPTYGNGGTGWDPGTLALGTGWSSAHDPKLRGPQLRALSSQLSLGTARQALKSPVEPGGGSGSNESGQQGRAGFDLQIPITALPGRGMDLALNLYYNSQIWTGDASNGFTFDIAADWPAPGFQLGFGRIGWFPGGSYIADADGTIHQAVRISYGSLPEHKWGESFRTIDGSFIDYRIEAYASSPHWLSRAVARLANGTEVEFDQTSGKDPSVVFPTKITDAQGNTIRIAYRMPPAIDTIVDTVGRIIRFHYDSKQALTAITAPGYGDGPARVVARLHYADIDLKTQHAFVGKTNARKCTVDDPCPLRMLDAVFYPATRTGFWLGSYNSNDSAYSSYGMLARVSEQRGMSMSFGPNPDEQGSVTSGVPTRERYYDYPMKPADLVDIPAYSQMYECWVSVPSEDPSKPSQYKAAVYHYRTDKVARTSTTYLPFGDPAATTVCGQSAHPQTQPIPDTARIIQKAYVKPTDPVDGQPEYTETLDASGHSLQRTTSLWEAGDSQGYPIPAAGSAYNLRLNRVERRDERGMTNRTWYLYGPWSNQIVVASEEDYDGAIVRTTETDYENDQAYRVGRHILNLPKAIRVRAGPGGQGPLVALTEIFYDRGNLLSTPGVVGRDQRFVKNTPEFDPGTLLRGLPNVINRYGNPAGPPGLSTTMVQEELRNYDETGNLVQVIDSACCKLKEFVFLPETQYAWPSRITQGAADPASPVRVQESSAYDFATGLPTQHIDVNGRTTNFFYEPDTLRLVFETPPTKNPHPQGPVITYFYDDMALSTMVAASFGPPPYQVHIASRSKTLRDGRGLIREQRSQAADGVSWDVVATEHDALGRLRHQSMAYRLNADSTPAGQISWANFTYDPLGRMTAAETPDTNGGLATSRTFFNETKFPPGVSSYVGSTVRTVDPVGHERWISLDSLGRLREVWEPDPAGNGSVLAPGGYQTVMFYDGLSMWVKQGARQLGFRSDGLGRLTHQVLPGRDATLQGPDGKLYSDVFEYDLFSHLIRHTDAARQGPLYVYENDGLRRLQRIERGGHLLTPINGPPPPSQTTTFTYEQNGDLRRLHSATTAGESTETYGYDTEGRPNSLKQTLLGRLFETGQTFDDFDRLYQIDYPARVDIDGAPRRKVTYKFGPDNRPNQVLVDEQPFADGITYDANGNLRDLVFVQGPLGASKVEELYRYHDNGARRFQAISVDNQTVVQATYNYYPSGQLQSIEDSDPAFGRSFTYDALARLTRVTIAKPTLSYGWEMNYGYDRYGNRTGLSAAGTLPGGAPIPPDGIDLSVDASGRITSPGYGYNAAGELVRRPGSANGEQTLDYDQDSRLASVALLPPNCPNPAFCPNEGSTEIYHYGADSRRLVSERTDNKPFIVTTPPPPPPAPVERNYHVWFGTQVLAEFAEVGTPLQLRWDRDHIYLGSRRLATIERAPQTGPGPIEVVQRHHPGLTGTRLVTESPDVPVLAISNNVLPFGTTIADNALVNQATVNRRFGGYERSRTTGLDYAVSRFYDHTTGRFTQPDPAGSAAMTMSDPQTFNSYGYARNDPVNRLDPLGLLLCDEQSGQCTDDGNAGISVIGTTPIDVQGLAPDDPDDKSISGGVGVLPGTPSPDPSGGERGGSGGRSYFDTHRDQFRLGYPRPMNQLDQLALACMAAPITAAAAALGAAPFLAPEVSGFVHVFWQGGGGVAAAKWAYDNGAQTVGMTLNGYYAELMTKGLEWAEARPYWVEASVDFARTASGNVHFFQSTSTASAVQNLLNTMGSPTAIWFTNELPELMSNPNVQNIACHGAQP